MRGGKYRFKVNQRSVLGSVKGMGESQDCDAPVLSIP